MSMGDVVYKFETLKKKAKEQVGVGRANGCFFPQEKDFLVLLPAIEERIDPRTLLDRWYREADKIIDRWDIRKVKKLIELFPGIVRKECLNREITCEIDDAENWLVNFKARQGDHHEQMQVSQT